VKRGAIINPGRLAAAPPVNRARFGAVVHTTNRAAIRESMLSFPDYRNGRLDGTAEDPELDICTCAALPVAAALMSAVANGGTPTIPWAPQQNILDLFGAVAGLPPDATLDQLAALQGLDPIDVLKHVVANGFDLGLQAPLVPMAGAINATDQSAIADGLGAGPLYSAVTLRQADEDAMAAGRVLDVVATPGGVVGGHMLVPFYDDGSVVWIATYGGWVSATWAWVMARGAAHFLLRWEPPVMPAGIDLGVVGGEAWAL
jgi:hypothetical protein